MGSHTESKVKYKKIRCRTTICVALACLCFSTGCTEQKAKALALAAQSFSTEAGGAIEDIRTLFMSDVAATIQEDQNEADQIAMVISKEKVNAAGLDELLKG